MSGWLLGIAMGVLVIGAVSASPIWFPQMQRARDLSRAKPAAEKLYKLAKAGSYGQMNSDWRLTQAMRRLEQQNGRVTRFQLFEGTTEAAGGPCQLRLDVERSGKAYVSVVFVDSGLPYSVHEIPLDEWNSWNPHDARPLRNEGSK